MDFGKRFRHYREKADLSQRTAATLIGVKYYQLCNYETNRSEPSLDTLRAMSKIYKVSVDTLLGNRAVIEEQPAESVDYIKVMQEIQSYSNKISELVESASFEKDE